MKTLQLSKDIYYTCLYLIRWEGQSTCPDITRRKTTFYPYYILMIICAMQLYIMIARKTDFAVGAVMLNLASVPRHWIKSWRQSLGWSRKEQLYCFARQKGPQQANALKTVSWPGGDSEEFCSNGSKRLWSARGHSSDWLGWSNWESSSSTSGSNGSGVCVLVGSIQLTFPT